MTEQELADGLKTVLFTSGWNDIIKPAMQKIESRASSKLLDAPDERTREQIIGELRMVKWILSWDRRYEEAAKRLAEIRAEAEVLPPEPVTTFNGGVV